METKTISEMTKAITLESIVEKFRDAVDYGWDLGNLITGIPDFKVMECLGFTPQSWTRYRPLLIQYCQHNDLIKEEKRDEIRIQTINIRMQYDKKNKQWYGKRNYLQLIDKDNSIQIMSEEELKKYNIVWIAEDKFSY
jgi:hypothetical protein